MQDQGERWNCEHRGGIRWRSKKSEGTKPDHRSGAGRASLYMDKM